MPPSGSKKKRAARRKKEKTSAKHNPNPNSNPLPPLPLLNHQGNGNSSTTEEEGEDETFETPKGHPDTPVAGSVPVGGFLQSDRFPVAAEGSTEKFYAAAAADDDNNGSEASIQQVNIDSDEMKNGLREIGEENHVIAGEGSFVVVDNPEDHLVGSEVVIGEEAKLDESLKDAVVPMEETVTVDEEPVEFHEAQTGNLEISLLEPVDASVLLGKEVKIVPWQDAEPPSVDFDAIPVRGDEGFRDMLLENSVIELDEGRAKELEGLEETNFEESAEQKSTATVQPAFIIEEVRKGSNGEVENVNSSAEGRGKELIPVVEALKEARLEKLADEICASVESSTLVTEKVNQGSNATAENLDKSLAGATLPEERMKVLPLPVEVKGVPAPDAAARTETSPRTEVARGPLVVRRASLWNCCGLLEVVTGSER